MNVLTVLTRYLFGAPISAMKRSLREAVIEMVRVFKISYNVYFVIYLFIRE